jgi:hypothetical protein
VGHKSLLFTTILAESLQAGNVASAVR